MYFVLGLVAAIVAVVYTKSIYRAEAIFDGIKKVPEWVKPAIGGALLGGLALAYGNVDALRYDHLPQIFGVGYDTISVGLIGKEAGVLMMALLCLKIISTSLSLGSGGSGGIFAPSLFIGSMLGGTFGYLVHALFPGIPAQPGAFALVGMGAVFAGATQASMTAMLIIFELTGDYKIILPLMFSVVTASLVSGALLRNETIYTLKLTLRGIRLRRGRDVDVLESMRVEEAMSDPVSIEPEATLQQLTELLTTTNRHAVPVMGPEGLEGIVSIADLRRGTESDTEGKMRVRDVMTGSVITVFPDDTLGEALRRMGPRDLSRLPVVARDNPRRLVGTLRRNDVVRAYNLAVTRRGQPGSVLPSALRKAPTVEALEIVLGDRAACVGKTVAEVGGGLPEGALLISIRRADGEIVFPHGDTRFRAGDQITALTRREHAVGIRRLFDDVPR
jgi:CIC family chloride channel protein